MVVIGLNWLCDYFMLIYVFWIRCLFIYIGMYGFIGGGRNYRGDRGGLVLVFLCFGNWGRSSNICGGGILEGVFVVVVSFEIKYK